MYCKSRAHTYNPICFKWWSSLSIYLFIWNKDIWFRELSISTRPIHITVKTARVKTIYWHYSSLQPETLAVWSPFTKQQIDRICLQILLSWGQLLRIQNRIEKLTATSIHVFFSRLTLIRIQAADAKWETMAALPCFMNKIYIQIWSNSHTLRTLLFRSRRERSYSDKRKSSYPCKIEMDVLCQQSLSRIV